MISWHRLLGVVLNLLALIATWSIHAKEPLLWAVIDFPPFQILSGPYQGSGSADGELKTLIANLPEFEHQIVPMSFARRKQEFMRGSNLCTPLIPLAPARALNLAVSIPALAHLDNRVIFLQENRAHFSEFAEPASIDAATLFSRQDLIGGISADRFYGVTMNPIIERFRNYPNLVIRPLTAKQWIEMLLHGHLDYVLMLSHEAAFQAHEMAPDKLLSSRALTGTTPYLFTHVACTGNAWGQEIINKINAILMNERKQPYYRSYSERWYSETDQAKVRTFYALMLEQNP